ncbi:MAG: hypothetical protein OXO53_11560 [Chloroflexota bacterium]|nr:hypothetical protein [Chloroflexota bacterium]
MKTTGYGIEESEDVENVHHLRLMALLLELVRRRGYKGAARVLEIDQRTVAESAKTGHLSRQVRDALERALQEGVGSAAERQRERNDKLAARIDGLERGHAALEKGQDELGRELRRRMAAVEGEVASLRRDAEQGTGAGHAGAGPRAEGPGEARSGVGGDDGERRATRPSARREYPDLVTPEPADDDEEVFGDAWPLIVEWRGLKNKHPLKGKGLAWLAEGERLLEVELALLEEHGMTLPPEKRPLRGFDRDGQTTWRRKALFNTHRERARQERQRQVRRVLTLGLWWD